MKILNILPRRHVPIAQFAATVDFYVALLGQPPRLAVEPIDGRLKITQVASMLIIGASDELLTQVSTIGVAYLVDDIAGWATRLAGMGAVVETDICPIPTGHYMIVRHPDGLRVEYVEHDDKHPLDRMAE